MAKAALKSAQTEPFEDYLNALLADLQNTVPGHNQHVGGGGSSVPGYGSLNGVRNKQTPSPQTYQTSTKTITETRSANGYNGSLPRSTGPHHNNSLPRSGTPQKLQTSASGNLSELDSLLQDLSSARYDVPNNGTTSPSPYTINETIKRPSVDSLLDELSNANANPIYAVPYGNQSPNPAPPGRQVTITVRETTTEKLTGTPSASYQNQMYQQQLAQNEQANYTSSATKELDDLMASLSDFKINAGSHQHQSVTDYAKPNQGTAHYQSTLTTVTTTEQLPPPNDQLDSMLGNLQADMSRQGVNTTQKGCCNACDKPIVGQVITALGKTWHPEHFTCNHCNQELGTRNFFERDGNPYCESDYHNLFSPRCAYCNGPILDKCVTALEKTWHTEHFFCAQCGQQFGEDGYHERDGKPYCRNDYFDMFAPKCNGCNRAIMENYISALNSQWHPDCFVCRINAGSHQHQSVTDYAKPNQGTAHYQSTLTTVTTTEQLPPPNDQLDSMLGNLQADMSRQGVNTTQKGCCNACDKPIVGQVITALGKTWHPEHFTCNHCNQELGTRNFFERDGNPYCESDYHNLFSPRCAYCNGPILDKCVTALEKTWHTEHFFCAQCGQQFGEDGYHERDGKPYCRNDYFDMFAPKCNGCNRAIMENYISALNSQWHPDCFVCRDCRQPFFGGSFFDHEGLPYCETHYHAKRGSLCAGCSKPITGRCITAMFKKFHPEHFVCAFCLKQLNKGTFKEQNDKPYCHQCFDKLFG